jgi:CO/xanthine dehydrogenase Mo-binding subunit
MHVNEDGTVVVATGSPDIGGSRASMAIMAAETLGIDYDLVRPIVADTASIGYTHVTGGSRVTFATGMAVVDTTKKIIQELCIRAAKMWGVDPEGVVWEDGCARPASSNVGDFKPLALREIAAKRAQTGGPIVAAAAVNPTAVAPGFATQFCDVEVDPETGKVKILRFVAAQDVGRAIHPSYVEGQIQGGVTQGIGWALNEEYIYNSQGHMENPGFLDYRIPVASDLPMIEPVMVEVPNPGHPYGAKGAAEVNICPPMAAIANAIERATGRRLTELPMSPPKVLAAILKRAGKSRSLPTITRRSGKRQTAVHADALPICLRLLSRATLLLPRCTFICLENRQHRAERHDIAAVIEGRCVQARNATSVKKQRIRAL